MKSNGSVGEIKIKVNLMKTLDVNEIEIFWREFTVSAIIVPLVISINFSL